MIFCQQSAISSKTIAMQRQGIPLSKAGFKVAIFKSIADVSADWETAQPADNCFLHRDYLKVVEANPSIKITFRYLIFYKNDFPVGVAFCPLYHYRTKESIKELREESSEFSLSTWFKKTLATPLNFNLLIVGNNLLTGEHGFYFNPNYVTNEAAIPIIDEAMKTLTTCLRKDGVKVHGYFIKDLNEWRTVGRQYLENRHFHAFTFNPNMFLNLRPEWGSFEEYLAAMTSKARTRIKKAIKEANSLEVRELNERQVEILLPEIFQLFNNVAERVAFNMVQLKPGYFLELKQELGDKFKIYGYFDPAVEGGKLIAFHTAFVKGKEYDAHFLGFEPAYNHSHKLYLNVLLNLVKQGIDLKSERIIFSRTAMEIKSSVGAEPENLYGYIRACSSLVNWFLGRLVRYFEPTDVWEQRRPFKD